jgi:FAD/FMN-containing dehydrogenase
MNAVKVSDDLDTVTVQTGATAGKVVYEVVSKSNHTRNVPVGQKPTVGMAGLTLGGGWGFASRQDGLLCDQLISVRMVLPGGEIVEATATNENSEIFWASCGGGGGNVGIATEFTMKTIKTPKRVTRVRRRRRRRRR